MKKVALGLVLTLFIVVFVPFYWATEPARQEAAATRQTREAAGRGAELYLKACAVCHGPRGEGRVGPPLKGTRLDEQVIRKIVSRGRPGTPMPAFGQEDGGPLKGHEISDLVAFIKNWSDSLLDEAAAHVPAPAAPPPAAKQGSGGIRYDQSTPRQVLLDGKSIAEKSCVACHVLPTAEQVKKFPADEGLVNFATVMTGGDLRCRHDRSDGQD
ncbi:MAG: cytochrome c [Dehalococcoidia bacterium]|nr:cytochrome c [Dehalococcoidia bacterium]